MRLSTSLFAGSLAIAACLSFPLVHAGVALAADPAAAAGAAKPSGNKPMHTVPEDGSGNDDMSASSRIVREVVAAHPNEDLVICIAGCRPGLDRVIYSQPADPLAKVKPAVAVSEEPATQPLAAQDTPAAPKVVNPSPDMQAEPAQSPVAQTTPAEPVKPAMQASETSQPADAEATQAAQPDQPASDGQARMEPTAAGDVEAPSASDADAPTEPSSDSSDASPAEDAPSDERPSEPPVGE